MLRGLLVILMNLLIVEINGRINIYTRIHNMIDINNTLCGVLEI